MQTTSKNRKVEKIELSCLLILPLTDLFKLRQHLIKFGTLLLERYVCFSSEKEERIAKEKEEGTYIERKVTR